MKIVQIAVSVIPQTDKHPAKERLYALCENGRVVRKYEDSVTYVTCWEALPEVPDSLF